LFTALCKVFSLLGFGGHLKFTHYFYSFAQLYCILFNSFFVIITSYRCSSELYSIGSQGISFTQYSFGFNLIVIGTAYAVT